MYSYIYDSFVNNKKYKKILSNIENEITDLGIKGRICRLTLLNTLKPTVEEEIRKGAHTIVVIGDDKTITQTLDIVIPKNVVLGIIPVGEDNQIAKLLGIPLGEEACRILSARIIKTLDVGKINDFYFINQAMIQSPNITLKCDSYNVTLLDNNQTVTIHNTPTPINDTLNNNYLLTEIGDSNNHGFSNFFTKKQIKKSVLNIHTLTINHSSTTIPILADGQKVIKSPVIIQKSPLKLKVIVGKNRSI